MKKKVLICCVVILLNTIFSGGLGYIIAYISGLQKLIDMDVRTRCHVLLLESIVIDRKAASFGVQGLVDAVELNCGGWASFIRTNEPYSSSDTKKRIAEALSAWEKTKNNLRKLRALTTAENQPAIEE